jgi:hypothetical protein
MSRSWHGLQEPLLFRVIGFLGDAAEDDQPPWSHLRQLGELSRAAAPDLVETLHWNNPVYLEGGARLWKPQAFKQHCSLRFPTGWFGGHRAEVEAAGFEAGEGHQAAL